MANPVVPAIRDFLLAHEQDIARGVDDFGMLRPAFIHMHGRAPAAPVVVEAPPPT